MTRIQFFGDLSGTGFGTVTMDLGRAMLALGEDVRFVSLNETPGDLPEPFASRTFQVGDRSGWLNMPTTVDEAAVVLDRITGLFTGAAWHDGWTPEAAIILGDFAAVRHTVTKAVDLDQLKIPLLHYVPIEGIDLPPRWASFWAKVKPVAMTEFGASQIARITGAKPPVIYHGIDTEAFYPVSPQRPIVITFRGQFGRPIVKRLTSKEECKALFGGDPERIRLFRADRHMPRKRYPELFTSLAPVLDRHPDVDLMYHCLTEDQGGNLDDARSKIRPDLARRMMSTRFHDDIGGVERNVLNALYNASDVYVSTSAEGFGLTIAEAMAAGVPAVGLGYSSVPEVIGAQVPETWDQPWVEGSGGYIVRPGGLVLNPYDHYWAQVDEGAFGDAVEHLITHKKRRRELGFLASTHIAKSFSWDTAARQFSGLAAQRVSVAA